MRVAIIDYGSGNLRSAVRAFERAACDHEISADITLVRQAEDILKADRVVLPGVGAYADCRAGLDSIDGLVQTLTEIVLKKGRPFMGICVGMQLMSSRGMEKTVSPGLDWIKGDVTLMVPEDKALKVPQIGWNTLDLKRDHRLFSNIKTGEKGLHAYFVHSYQLHCQNTDELLATTDYGGAVTAAVIRDNMFGTQFHPEKSQRLGLQLIANFLEWKP
ncbi:imidazole glycerol phosphate synthase subunit HisH [uncultured Bartonella sp.]|uniref:imidazole glycerol phosphate synthase subunit HisH n=1 Tax=uncultured Bartonella sp. TaxID=104108 RepID=UPI002605C05E|nr:imidazole glycerol phosphate synthase subunit HisH [uncultured Bartonella sp.]